MGHSFKLEDNIKKGKKTRMDYSLILMIFFIFIAISCILVYFIMGNQETEDYIPKKDREKEYVYTVQKQENENSESGVKEYDLVPILNLEGDKYTQINNEIESVYRQLVKSNQYIYYDYQFNQSKNILSLMIKYIYYPKQNIYPIVHFDTYNIDLASDKILTDDEILDQYDVSEKQLNVYMEAKFKKYYTDIVKNGYYTKEQCSYTCFLKNRGISKDYLENISFYVDHGKLTLFKYYYPDSEYNEIEFFTDDSYQFLIKE